MSSPQLTRASNRAGVLIPQQSGVDGFSAFIPAPLPPDPPLDFSGPLRALLERASHSLGRLDGISGTLEPDLLLYMYVRKEAVLSSQIEGTQSTLSDLLEYENAEAAGVPVDDVREVSRYVRALHSGMERLREGIPPSLRLIREMHGVLMQEGRGATQDPGEFRRTQNWIGGSRPGTARFVPPPPHELGRVLGDLERFMIDSDTTPLVKAGLVHAQFETIHPFLDGNGRIGRLLITLLLCAGGALRRPFLYLSLYFKLHRDDYYDALQRVRSYGDWERWMAYFLDGVDWTARQATRTTEDLLALFASDRERILSQPRTLASTLKVYEHLRGHVITTIRRGADGTGLTTPTVATALQRLATLGIVREVTGRKYGRQFVYDAQLAILNRTDDPPNPVVPSREDVWREAFDAAEEKER